MNLLTRQSQADNILHEWKSQYYDKDNKKWIYPSPHSNKEEIYNKLKDVQSKVGLTAESVNNIIGNQSWTNCRCGECGANVDSVIHLGEEPDYDSYTFYVCKDCLIKALGLINKEWEK